MLQSNICRALPPLILGALCLAGSLLVLFLPETLNRTIPCTLEDGERFGIGDKIFDFACFEKPTDEKQPKTNNNDTHS